MKPRSDNLFHFTKSIDILESILKNGFYARYCLEDIRWLNSNEDKFIAFPMVCFCDIPLSRATEHTEFYGSYGLGLTKDWGIRNNLNPVVYGTDNGLVRDAIHYFFDIDLLQTFINDGLPFLTLCVIAKCDVQIFFDQ